MALCPAGPAQGGLGLCQASSATSPADCVPRCGGGFCQLCRAHFACCVPAAMGTCTPTGSARPDLCLVALGTSGVLAVSSGLPWACRAVWGTRHRPPRRLPHHLSTCIPEAPSPAPLHWEPVAAQPGGPAPSSGPGAWPPAEPRGPRGSVEARRARPWPPVTMAEAKGVSQPTVHRWTPAHARPPRPQRGGRRLGPTAGSVRGEPCAVTAGQRAGGQ